MKKTLCKPSDKLRSAGFAIAFSGIDITPLCTVTIDVVGCGYTLKATNGGTCASI